MDHSAVNNGNFYIHRQVFKWCVFCSLVCLSAGLSAQKEYYTWYFGHYAGLSFHTKTPTALHDNNRMNASEGTSGICDRNGNLLFYTNGDTIFNRNHQVMKNGLGQAQRKIFSSRQGAMAVPMPGNDSLYYLFSAPSYEYYHIDSSLTYWVINAKGDGGLGEVIQKQVPMMYGGFENFAVTLHANQSDYWIASNHQFTGFFQAVRTINGMVDTHVVVTPINKRMWGTLKFSPDGNIVAGFLERDTQSISENFFHLYHFDKSTGSISGKIRIRVGMCYNLEFSPDSRFLYIVYDSDPFVAITQFDLSSWDSTLISNSAYKVDTFFSSYSGMQLAPDGKIYCFNTGLSKISVINKPDKKGAACGFKKGIIDISPQRNWIGGFYHPTFRQYPFANAGPDTALCTGGDSVTLNGCVFAADSFYWSTGDTTLSIRAGQPGIYILTAIRDTFVDSDTIVVKDGQKFKVYLGNDTAFCGQFSHLLKAGPGAKTYAWSTGASTYSITVDTAGIYHVQVKDSNSCGSADTIRIGNIRHSQLQATMDSIECKYVYLSASPRQENVSYTWNTGDTGLVTKTQNKGIHYLTTSHVFCSMNDTIKVDKLPKPGISLGTDTTFCGDFSYKLKADTGYNHYSWNTGDTTSSIQVDKEGLYWVQVNDFNFCHTRDSIHIGHIKNYPAVVTLDSVSCQYIYLSAAPRQNGVSYTWSTGDTGLVMKTQNSGTYYLTASHTFCTYTDTVIADKLPQPVLNLGDDTLLCDPKEIILSAEDTGVYTWNTGEKTKQITVKKPGLYRLEISRNGCKATDEVQVLACPDITWYIPNSFSPNGDGINEVFGIKGEQVSYVKMQVYNRWGEKIFEGEGKDISWDGRYKGTDCPEGAYVCILQVKGSYKSKPVTKNHVVSFTLIR